MYSFVKPFYPRIIHTAILATGHQKIMIQTVGNDVVVFWLWLQHRFPSQKKNFGWHLAVADHEMSTRLGPENALALPVFHALTGCNSVSSFVGHGRKTAWAVWVVFPELMHVLSELSSAPGDIL